MRRSVAEWPWKRPRIPSCWLMSRIALTMPNHDPVYFANWGLEAWKRILTRSRGPTTVLAWDLCVRWVFSSERNKEAYSQHILTVPQPDRSLGHSPDSVYSCVSGFPPPSLLSSPHWVSVQLPYRSAVLVPLFRLPSPDVFRAGWVRRHDLHGLGALPPRTGSPRGCG